MRAAVPKKVGTDFSKAPPGHRFRLYFEVWNDGWTIDSQKKKDAVARVLDMGPAREIVEALNARSRHFGEGVFRLDAVATAPFVTGMGMEHPLENGFAFLDPYGVPYLPGSSVKGVLRRAAEELALFEADSRGWTLAAVWWLFGFDASSGFFGRGKKDDPEPIREERERWHGAYRKWSAGFSPQTPPGESGSAAPGPHDPGGILEAFRRLVDRGGKLGTTAADFLQALEEDASARNSIHTRGSLGFRDVIPLPGKGDTANLRVDIMNPHYTHYYQGKEPPHDAGSPNPIFYLTVPPGWRFPFTVDLLPVRGLPAWFTEETEGVPRWQALLHAAFEHAFDWLGFGAKTSLGYGGMDVDREAEERARKEAEARQREEERRQREEEERRAREEEEARLAAMTPLERELEKLQSADHDGFIEVFRELDRFEGEEQRRLAEALKGWMQEHGEWKIKKKKGKKWDRVRTIKEILGEAT